MLEAPCSHRAQKIEKGLCSVQKAARQSVASFGRPLAEPKEKAPCANCLKYGAACSLAGGPHVRRDVPTSGRVSPASTGNGSQVLSQEGELSNDLLLVDADAGVELPPSDPFVLLTEGIERPLNGKPFDWKLQVQLTHYYMANTKLVMTEHYDVDLLLQLWHMDLPKIGFEHEYVMHGLLGLSALHKARQEPEHSGVLEAAAIHHLDQAVCVYHKATTLLRGHDTGAQFAFLWLMTVAGFAMPYVISPIDAMVEVFSLLRRMNTSLAATWDVLMHGPMSPLVSLIMQGSAMLSRRR
nr:sterol uptake control protein 2 [Quercus suber]